MRPSGCSPSRASTPPPWTRSRTTPATPRARSTPTSRPRRTCFSRSTNAEWTVPCRRSRQRSRSPHGDRGTRADHGGLRCPPQHGGRLARGVLRVLGACSTPCAAAEAVRRAARSAARHPRARGGSRSCGAGTALPGGTPQAGRRALRDAARPRARAADAAGRGRRRAGHSNGETLFSDQEEAMGYRIKRLQDMGRALRASSSSPRLSAGPVSGSSVSSASDWTRSLVTRASTRRSGVSACHVGQWGYPGSPS